MGTSPKSTSNFEFIADAIAAKYLAQVKMLTAKLGTRPPFEDLMEELKNLEKELTKEGVSHLEDCSSEQDFDVKSGTEDIKNIIKATIETFVKQL